MNLLMLFIILTIVNVIGSTIRSIVVIKCGKWLSAFSSALYYGYYNIVLIYTVSDFPLWQKVVVTFGCNLVGVFIVKLCEEKGRKEKLWKIECTIPTDFLTEVDTELVAIPHSYIKLSNKHTVFNFYCATQKESAMVKEIISKYDAKYFVAESKEL